MNANKSFLNNHKLQIIFYSFILFCYSFSVKAENSSMSRQNSYINKYSALAIKQMNEYNIPASIILAQGLLESQEGTSYLAREGNNHFGIKCYNNWRGPAIYKDDDKPNECFKKYSTVNDAFSDHSNFLQRDRYKDLYSLRLNDYKGWAHGLKKAGYATDKHYATKLIGIIEKYELYRFDNPSKNLNNFEGANYNSVYASNTPSNDYGITNTNVGQTIYLPQESSEIRVERLDPVLKSYNTREVKKINGIKYVIVRNGDSFYSIAQEFGIKVSDLYDYNELPPNTALMVGQLLYVYPKKAKADARNYEHVVQSGESMHVIAQQYGIKLSSIYKLNKLPYGSAIAVGDVLKLR